MDWKTLLSDKRCSYTKPKNAQDLRTEFQRDYHRIIGSASFRRLQDKTQVFPLDRSDFVRTRLTHSLEVSSFAKSLGQSCFTYLIENNIDPDINESTKEAVCNILECAGLIHDIGNPPFGHFGEDTIREWFRNNLPNITFNNCSADKFLDEQMKRDLYNFEGNAQALRLLTKLHYLVDENGMHLTYALLNTIIKYPVSSLDINKESGNIKDKKMGYYFAEHNIYEEISNATGAKNCRYPLTYLLEAADDIAYKTADIEDAIKKNYITYDILLEELSSEKYIRNCKDDGELRKYKKALEVLHDKLQKAIDRNIPNPEQNAVQNWAIFAQGFFLRCADFAFTNNYKKIMNGEFKTDLLTVTYGSALADALSDIAYRYVFSSKSIVKMEIVAEKIITFLLDKFVNAAINFENTDKMSIMDTRIMCMVSDNYKQIYRIYSDKKSDKEKLYLRMLLITDFICGMTDSYAKSLYQEFNGID